MRDAQGRPVEGLQVSSLETDARTDADGRFAVVYKEPDRHVHFTIGQTWFRRQYRPEDDGKIVEIVLPELRDPSLVCGPRACDATLTWTGADGLTARATARCAPGLTIPLDDVPVSTPTLECREDTVQPTLTDRGDTLILEPPLQTIRVELRSLEGALPTGCRVQVGDREARPAGEAFWVADVATKATVTAVCGDRPARPATVTPDIGTVTLDWSPEGAALDLADVAPWVDRVHLRAEDGEEPGWSIALAPTAQGLVLLPPLTRGRYEVRVDGDAPAAGSAPTRGGRPHALVLAPVPGGESLVGALEVASDLLDGTVPVTVAPAGDSR